MTLRSRLVQRGAVAVEAAIVLIPLLLVVLGIAEGGRLFFQYNTLLKTTRDAARYLSTVAPGANNNDPTYATARCLVVHGNATCQGSPLVERLAAGDVEICDARLCSATHSSVPATGNGGPATGVMNLVTVTVPHFEPALFIGVTMPIASFGPISVTMRQAL